MKQLFHPRNRSTITSEPTSWYEENRYDDGRPTTKQVYPAGGVFDQKIMGDQVNTGFRRIMRQGGVVMGSMTLTRSTRDPGGEMNFSLHVPQPNNGGWTNRKVGDFSSAGFENSINSLFTLDLEKDLDGMAGVALTKALARVNAADLMSGEYMAEFSKTAMMLRHPFKGATDLVSRMVKTRNRTLKKSGSNAVLAASNAWLEHCYGWKPILIDAEKVVDLVHKKREPKERFLVARAQENQDLTMVKEFSLGSIADPAWNRAGTARRTITARAAAGVMYELKNRTSGLDLGRILGTRAVDLPQTAWNLIPYSFVADWFTNIGDWIRASTPDPEVSFRGRWTTIVYKKVTALESCTFTHSQQGENGIYVRSASPMNLARWTSETVQRDVNPDAAPFPVVTVNLSPPHVLSGLALSAQQILGRMGSLRH